jgi:hypothetical protein
MAGGYLEFAVLQRGDAGVISNYVFAVPILSARQGLLLFDEHLTLGLGLGAVAVAAGIVLVTVPGRSRVIEEAPRLHAVSLLRHPGTAAVLRASDHGPGYVDVT